MKIVFMDMALPTTDHKAISSGDDIIVSAGYTYDKDNNDAWYHHYGSKDEWAEKENAKNKSGQNIDMKGQPHYENPWQQISYIYDRFFMFLHIFITIMCFVVIYLFYRSK